MEQIIERRKTFNLGSSNKDIVIVNEGVAITGYINLAAYGLGGHLEDYGFEATFSVKNESGADRDITWAITNESRGTTLSSGTNTLSDGEFSTLSLFYTLEQVSNGEYLRFTLGGDGIGTAVASGTFAQMSFEVKSIFLTDGS